MRFLGALAVALVVVACFGYYRGWFDAKSHDSPGQHSVTVTVDKDKINQDKDKARQDIHDLEHR
jgi:hypothetical protein